MTVALVCAAGAQDSAQRDKQFQAALHREMVDGDLKAAIEDYRRISSRSGVGRELAATALVRMAECYRKLGDEQARQVYARVVREFSDQPIAAEARARLSAMGGAAEVRVEVVVSDERISRVVWSGAKVGIFLGGVVSRDGRLFPYTDWSTGNLALHDLTTGRDTDLTTEASFAKYPRQQYAGYSRISPDGRRVAYSWLNGERYELRMLDLGSGRPSPPRLVYMDTEVSYIHPFDWSPDGTRLAVQLRREDRTGQIGLVSVATGTLTVLKSFPWREESEDMFFSPDGHHLGYDLPAEDDPGDRDVYVLAVDGSREVRVAPHRRNDEMVGWSQDGKRLLFASDRTGSVQLWAQSLSGLEMQGPPRVVPSDFGGFSRSAVGISSSGALFYVATTYEGSPFRTIDFDFNSGRATGTPSDPGEEFYSINAVAHAEWSPDGTALALWRNRGGASGGPLSVVNLDGSLIRHVRPNPQVGPSTIWSHDGKAFVGPGADRNGRRGLFRVDAVSGEGTPLMLASEGEEYDAPALAPDGRTLYYRHETPSAVRIVARALASGVERELIRRPRLPTDEPRPVLAGMQLSPNGQWMVTSSLDRAVNQRSLLAISVSSGESRELLRGSGGRLELLMWAPDSGSVFVRRVDAGRDPDVLRIPISGGEPVKIDWTLGHDTQGFRVHPDGRHMVFVKAMGPAIQSEVRVLPGIAR